ncbi:phage tail tube protein [Devosia sp. A449]
MTFHAAAGTKLFISSMPIASSAALAVYEAAIYVEVKGIEDLGEFGDEAEVVTFTTLEDSRVRKLKGTSNAGAIELVVGRNAADPGQIALRAATKTRDTYGFKIELDDAPAAGEPSTFYMAALVMSGRVSVGEANDVVRQTFNLEIDSEPLEVAAA